MRSLKIPQEEAGQRLDKYLAKYLNKAPRGFLYKMLRKKNIKRNGKRAEANMLLEAGDILELYLAEETMALMRDEKKSAAEKKLPQKGKEAYSTALRLSRFCSILYEDEALILADKKAGVLSQKSSPSDISLNEALLAYVEAAGEKTASGEALLYTPSICNRLDRNTTGLITFAKTYAAGSALSELFRGRTMHKDYLAAISGRLDACRLNAWLLKDEKTNRVTVSEKELSGAVRIETELEPVLSVGGYSLVKLRLLTGKTHQLRAQLAAIGHPILGDPKYGNMQENNALQKKYGIRYQMLHAYQLSFPKILPDALHQLAGRSFTAPLPDTFHQIFPIEDFRKR